jgi:phage host-nuclease inhibitor protein Gam
MAAYEITAEMNLKKIIDESREVAQALTEFADNLEQIEKKYAEPQESEGKK